MELVPRRLGESAVVLLSVVQVSRDPDQALRRRGRLERKNGTGGRSSRARSSLCNSIDQVAFAVSLRT